MIPDSELLHSYAERKSETAFAEVVGRHVNLVYSTALRLANHDAHLAQDITQVVFAELARNAVKLSRHPSLAGWLHTSARFAARNVRVSEQRRRARELQAAMEEHPSAPVMVWEEIKPALDEAVGKLDRLDREAVLLRFFDTKSHREIGDLLGLSENAARMRVERALEKLRKYFGRRGVKASAALLGAAMAANSVQAAPAGLAASLPGAALAGAAAKAGKAALLARIFFGMGAKTKVMLVAVVVAGGLVSISYIRSGHHPALDTRAAATLFDPPVSDALVRANNQFAIDLYRQLAANPRENLFFSPHSVATGLAMTWAGARGQTAAQMANVLHFDGLNAANVTVDFGVLQRALARDCNRVQLLLANSLWGQQDHPFLGPYMKSIRQDFDAELFPVDFTKNSGAAGDSVNRWTSDKTNGLIAGIIRPGEINDQTRLLLVNAIYFKGDWISKFDAAKTSPRPFHLADGSDKNIPMMYKDEPAKIGFIQEGPVALQVLSLPYRGGALSFIVLLPQAYDGLPELEKILDAEKISQWVGDLKPGDDDAMVVLPKFKLTQRFDLNARLQALGMKDAFTSAADFSGMDGARDLFLARAVHQAEVDVNEVGTVAAAAIHLSNVLGAARPFIANHPFVFLIRDDSNGSILFMGRFATPP